MQQIWGVVPIHNSALEILKYPLISIIFSAVNVKCASLIFFSVQPVTPSGTLMKSFMLSLAGSYRFTERRDECQSPSNPPPVDLNIVIIWMITRVAKPATMKGKMSHPVMRQSLSAVWSGSNLTIPQGLPDYIGLARGVRSIINTESCQSLYFTPQQCKTRLHCWDSPCLDLLWHDFREMSAATAGKITAMRQTAVAVITLRRAEET